MSWISEDRKGIPWSVNPSRIIPEKSSLGLSDSWEANINDWSYADRTFFWWSFRRCFSCIFPWFFQKKKWFFPEVFFWLIKKNDSFKNPSWLYKSGFMSEVNFKWEREALDLLERSSITSCKRFWRPKLSCLSWLEW